MVAVISPEFAAALERCRDRLNARWRLRRPRGAPEEFLAVVAQHLDRPVAAVVAGGAAAEAVDRVCTALFDAALDLWTRGALGASDVPDAGDPMAALFHDALPTLPRVLVARPDDTVRSLSQAVLSLRREGSVDVPAWVEDLAAVGPLVEDRDALRAAGVVLAWRRGLTHARDAALAALPGLPAPLVAGLAARMGLRERTPDDVASRLGRRWRADPTRDAGPRRLAVVGFAGAFEAFGGPFAVPPQVGVDAASGRIVAGQGGAWWALHADDFGTMLRPAGAAPPPARASRARVTADGTVAWRGLTATIPALAGAASWAESGDTLAVACGDSHRVRLVAVLGEAP